VKTEIVSIPEDSYPASQMLEEANSFKIVDQSGAQEAVDRLRLNREMQAKVRAGYDESIARAHELHSSLIAARDKYLKPLQEAERLYKNRVAAWHADQEAARREEENRLRIEMEAAAKRDRENEIRELQAAGRKADVKALKAQPVDVPQVVLPAVKAPDGVSVGKTWDYQITNENQVPREFCSPDPKKIKAKVAALKGDTKIPGVRVFEKLGVSMRGMILLVVPLSMLAL